MQVLAEMRGKKVIDHALYVSKYLLSLVERKKDKNIESTVMANVGIEPKTFALLARRSNQLS